MAAAVQAGASQGTRVKIVAAFLAIYLIWGTTFLGIRIAVETLPPFMMAGLRFFLAGGAMLPILLARGGRFPSLRHWRSAAIVGGLMLASIPVWITLFEWLGFGGKRPGAQTFIGLGLGLAGAALLFVPAVDTGAGGCDLVGLGIVLLGALIFAIGSLYARRAPL